MKSNSPNTKCGLTLTELLIGISILSIVGIMVAGVYITHFRLFSNQSTTIDVAGANRVALDEMTNQIREAALVVATGVAVSGCTGTPASDSDSLVLALWPLDASTGDPVQPSPAPTTDPTKSDRVIYCVDTSKKNLVKSTIPRAVGDGGSKRLAATKILATNLATTDPTNGLLFTYYDANNNVTLTPTSAAEVKIELKISAGNFNKSQTFTSDLETRAVLRNK